MLSSSINKHSQMLLSLAWALFSLFQYNGSCFQNVFFCVFGSFSVSFFVVSNFFSPFRMNRCDWIMLSSSQAIFSILSFFLPVVTSRLTSVLLKPLISVEWWGLVSEMTNLSAAPVRMLCYPPKRKKKKRENLLLSSSNWSSIKCSTL